MPNNSNFFKTAEILLLIGAAFAVIRFTAPKVYEFLSFEGRDINIDDAQVPEVLSSAENCSSPYTINEIISQFKENDLIYKSILPKTIDSRNIKQTEILFQDSHSQAFICSGIIEIKSSSSGFRPENYDFDNLFYIQARINDDDYRIKKYTAYEIPVIYTSEMTENGNVFLLNKIFEGSFSCSSLCAPVYIADKPAPYNNPVKAAGQIKNTQDKQSAEKAEKNKKDKTSETADKPVSKLKKIFNFFRRKK